MGRKLAVVFTKFDNGGPSDKLYDELIAPACREAGFDPYRVDKDPEAVVPFQTLKQKIREAAVCIADLTANSENVCLELGAALALEKDVIPILNGKKVPFDVRHLNVLFYKTQSPSDFDLLRRSLIERLNVIARAHQEFSDLTRRDVKVLLALLWAPDGLTEYGVSRILDESGAQIAKTNLSIRKLERLGFISQSALQDFDGDALKVFALTDKGYSWLRQNREEC